MSDIIERLREPVMLRYNAEQVNAERREAAAEIERLHKEARKLSQLRTQTEALFKYTQDLRRNPCGSDDYPWELMRAVANEIDRIMALPSTTRDGAAR
jgi:hypothetical protein